MEIKEIVDYVIKTPDNSNPAVLKDILLKYTDEISKKSGPDPSKLIKFLDYDGTLIYSYTPEEFIKLKELPKNPSHSRLTAQGWNWTLAQIKERLTAMPDAPVWVGQMYITDDGKTRLYCHFEKGRLAPYFGIGVNGTVVVDWGDGSSTDTLTGTSLTTAETIQHTYASAGDYIITLTVSSGSFSFFGTSGRTWVLTKNGINPTSQDFVYANAIRKVELGANTSIDNSAFDNCYSLANITIPNGVTSIGDNAFHICYNLASVTIPNGVTSIGKSAFGNCYGLTNITIPNGVTSIGKSVFSGSFGLTSITIPDGVTSIIASAFYNCQSLASITIPDGVTSIDNSAFSNCYTLANITIPNGVTSIGTNTFQLCYGLGEIHFKPTTPPIVSGSNAWSNIPTDCKIYVPAGTLSAYTSATNYPSSSTYTYVEE